MLNTMTALGNGFASLPQYCGGAEWFCLIFKLVNMKVPKGFFKMCAGCSIKEKRAGLNEGQFYCNIKGDVVYETTDASACDSFDRKNVVNYIKKR